VKRASSGRALVASGAEAGAGAGCVGAAPAAAGWSRRQPRAPAQAARRQGGAGGRRQRLGRHGEAPSDGGDGSLSAVACGRVREDGMKRCGWRLKSFMSDGPLGYHRT
jgi:hypothetical protein